MTAIRHLFLAACAAASLWLSACAAEPAPQACNPVDFDGAPFTVCSFAMDRADNRLFLTHPDGAPYAQFDRLAAQLEADGTPLLFAMNGGMYHDDRRAVGLYVEDGKQAAPLVTSAGPGNFGMRPTGVFWIDGGEAGITETRDYDALFPVSPPRFATQSGPMFVLDGVLHPDFNADGPSRKRRNGVGLSADGRTVQFAISDGPVNLHSFARLFQDRLGTPNALYLDGVVSRLYAPEDAP